MTIVAMNRKILPSRLVKRLRLSQKGFIVKTQNKLIKTLDIKYRSWYGNGFEIPNQINNGNDNDSTFIMMGFIDDIIIYMV